MKMKNQSRKLVSRNSHRRWWYCVQTADIISIPPTTRPLSRITSREQGDSTVDCWLFEFSEIEKKKWKKKHPAEMKKSLKLIPLTPAAEWRAPHKSQVNQQF